MISSDTKNRLVGLVCMGLFVLTAGLLISADAVAIDGNYASPYASQYDTRAMTATIPNETLLGILLLLINLCAATFFALRDNIRRRRITN